jgi:hypothetical protein
MGNTSAIIAERRGMPVYVTNPSIPTESEINRSRRRQLGDERRGLVIADTGEILGPGAAVAYEWEEVDKERFVKLFLVGVKQATGLSKPGLVIFEMVYNALREKPGLDTVQLAASMSGLKKTTYYKGVRELLQKGFIYNSPYEGVFFVNIRYMFNGDRLAFVKAYHLKGTKPPSEQLSLLPGLEADPPAVQQRDPDFVRTIVSVRKSP